jgi:protein-tyrosine phosphatase
MTRLLFVCLGNICRSPLAEAIFEHQIRQNGLHEGFYSESCGTANYHVGHPPDPRTLRNAAKNGITIQHLGRQFHVNDFNRFDLILPMDKSNWSNLLKLPGAAPHEAKIKLMRTFDPLHPGADVPDPYYGGEDDFQEVFDILHRSAGNLIEYLKRDDQFR